MINKMMKIKTENVLCRILGCSAIVLAFCGIITSINPETFFVENVYGQPVELYGKGIYAYNSILTVSSRLGADFVGILGGCFLIILTFLKNDKIWVEILKTSQCVVFVYYFACLTLGIAMNTLYLFYVCSFGISILLSIHLLSKFFKQINVKEEIKISKNVGVIRCLFISSLITIFVWSSMIVPCLISKNFGELLGVLTTEITYAIDLGILCPLMIICAIWIKNKDNAGYKLAPILLYVLFSVGPMVILQNLYCVKLDIQIPIPAFIGTILSFVVMSGVALIYLRKSIKFLVK